jgi:hypothetical protein
LGRRVLVSSARSSTASFVANFVKELYEQKRSNQNRLPPPSRPSGAPLALSLQCLLTRRRVHHISGDGVRGSGDRIRGNGGRVEAALASHLHAHGACCPRRQHRKVERRTAGCRLVFAPRSRQAPWPRWPNAAAPASRLAGPPLAKACKASPDMASKPAPSAEQHAVVTLGWLVSPSHGNLIMSLWQRILTWPCVGPAVVFLILVLAVAVKGRLVDTLDIRARAHARGLSDRSGSRPPQGNRCLIHRVLSAILGFRPSRYAIASVSPTAILSNAFLLPHPKTHP